MIKIIMMAVSGVILMSSIAYAELFVCGNQDNLRQWFFRDIAAQVEGDCHVVPLALTSAQFDLVSTLGRFEYARVVNGLAQLKSQAEIDAINAALAQEQADAQAFRNELDNSTFCNAQSLNQASQLLQTRHDQIETAIANVDNNEPSTIRAILEFMADDNFQIQKGILRCLVALIQLSR